jgi:signal transduction histidine kinase
MLKKDLGKQPSLDELNELVSNTIQEIRSITYGLRPFQLDLLGLTQSLKSLTEGVAEAGEIKFQTKIDNIDGLVSREAEIYIFRIVQECLNNISKHSHASEALVEIKNPADKINIVIEDNGIGIEKKPNGNGFGIIGIKERVTILNGKLEIISNEPKGTKIRIQI